MRIPEKVYCDFCGKENPEHRNKLIPVLTDCSWEDGMPCRPRIDVDSYDICSECLLKITNVKAGYRGTNPKFIRE